MLYTHLAVRDDAHTLYGFSSTDQRSLFRSLIRVTGVGARMALAILSGMEAAEFIDCVRLGRHRPPAKNPRHRPQDRRAPPGRDARSPANQRNTLPTTHRRRRRGRTRPRRPGLQAPGSQAPRPPGHHPRHEQRGHHPRRTEATHPSLTRPPSKPPTTPQPPDTPPKGTPQDALEGEGSHTRPGHYL